MSFKDVILPDFVIADLFAGSITTVSAAKTGVSPTKTEVTTAIDGSTATIGGSNNTTEGSVTRTRVSPANTPDLPSATATTQPSPDEVYRYLGKNQKKVSIIARYKDDPYIPEEHLQFLIKILSACKLNLGDVAILNDASGGVSMAKLKKQLNPAFVLLFGVEPAEIGLPLNFPPLRPQLFEACYFLNIPAIDSLLPDTETAKGLKKQLWDCLKKMFSV
ncbi:hypothetical protein ACX0G7_23425 [Flavitalea antarctica]